MKTFRNFIAITCCLLLSGMVYAAPQALNFNGNIEYINDPNNALNGQLNVGDMVNGFYGYDTDIPDNDSSVFSAYYYLPAPLPAELGFMLEFQNLPFTKFDDTDLSINLFDDGGYEYFNAVTCCNAGMLGDRISIQHIAMHLNASAGSALNGASLATMQDLNQFQDKILIIDGIDIATGGYLTIVVRLQDISTPPPVCLLCSLPPAPDHVAYTAVVRDYSDPSNSMSDYFGLGRKFTGLLRFDPNVPDENSSPEYGFYYQVNSPGGKRSSTQLTFANGTFNDQPDLGNMFMHVMNMSQDYGMDSIDIISSNTNIMLPNGGVVNEIFTSFRDHSGKTLFSDTLRESLTEPLHNWQAREVMINGTSPNGDHFFVIADIVSLEQEKLSTSGISMFPASGTVIQGQNFDVSLVIDTGPHPVIEAKLNLFDGLSQPIPHFCHVGGNDMYGRTLVFCGNLALNLQHGVNQFQIEVKYADESTAEKTGYWQLIY